MNKGGNVTKEDLLPLIEEARKQGLWLHYPAYRPIWFSPDELEAENKQGKYLLDPSIWRLRDPSERLEELFKAQRDAIDAAKIFMLRLAQVRELAAKLINDHTRALNTESPDHAMVSEETSKAAAKVMRRKD